MQEAALAKQNGVPSMSQSRGGGDVFVETFANGLAGTNGNGAWTVNDNQDGTLWISVGANGQGQYQDGTPTGSTHPGGAYSTNIGALESTTAMTVG